MLMCFSLWLKPALNPSIRAAVQPPVLIESHKEIWQCRIISPDTLTLAFKRLRSGWSDYSVPVFWERTIHTAVCGVNAKQTCLAHASPSAVMALLSKPHAEQGPAYYSSQSIRHQRLWVNAHPCSQAIFLINTETSAERDSVTERSSMGSVLAYL